MAPIHIVALYDSDQEAVNVSLICDKLEVDYKGLEVSMNIYKWSDLFPKKQTVWPVALVILFALSQIMTFTYFPH